jgi:hypothetical protein
MIWNAQSLHDPPQLRDYKARFSVNKTLIGLSVIVALSVGYFGSRLVPALPMAAGHHSIIFVLVTSILAVALIVLLYLRRELRMQKERHKLRRADYGGSAKIQALSPDELAVFHRRIMRNLDLADRKRLIFQIVQNTLLVFAGLLPMLSTIVDSNETQKLLSFGASFSAFIVGLFSMSKYTVEHRRTGFLIEKALDSWLVGNGDFHGLTKADAFRELVSQVQTILDTNETSFVGAGTVTAPLFDQDEPDEGPTISQDDSTQALSDFPEVFPDESPRQSQPTPEAVSTTGSMGRISTAEQQAPSRIESVVPESSVATAIYQTPIAPEDFAAWQAAQLGADSYDEITQG